MMTTPDLSGVEQLPQPDIRGWLALRYLPYEVQKAEDATHFNDYDHAPRGRTRAATGTERMLLEFLGHGPLPDDLQTQVTFKSRGVRCRRWLALES